MYITIFSFLSTVLWHSIFTVCIYLLRKLKGLQQFFSVFCLVILYLISAIRMFLPIELTNSMIIESPKIYPVIYGFLHKVCWENGLFKILVWQALLFVWILVALILLMRFCFQYSYIMRQIKNYAAPCDARAQKMLQLIKRKRGKAKNIALLHLKGIAVPMGIGVFKRHILMPNDFYEDKKLYYILLHEYTHYINRDFIVKLFISMFCIMFWWNPFVYLLKKDLEQALEIKCDLSVTKHLDTNEKADYLTTIVDTLKRRAQSKKTLPYMCTALFKKKQAINIKERFSIVITNDAKKRYIPAHLATTMFLLFVILSYMLLPQPVFEAPAITNSVNTFEFGSSNAYLKETAGQYELFIDDESQGNISAQEAKIYIADGFKILKQE